MLKSILFPLQLRGIFHISLKRSIGLINLIIVIAGFFLLSPQAAFAQSQFNLLSVVTENCRTCGACSVCDLLSVVTKGMRFMLSLSGALALAIFVYGGFELMISQGKAEAVEHGKKMVTGTVVALGIILLMAWVWPNWVIIALKGIPADGKPQTIFSNDAWWVTPCVKYQGTETCEKEPASRPKLFESDRSGCVAADASGRPSGSKPAGTTCPLGGACRQLPCVCGQNGACVQGCATDLDCQARDKSLNYCHKVGTAGQVGFCEQVTPGTSCKGVGESMCTEFAVGTGTYVTVMSDMTCNTIADDGVCRIKDGQRCDYNGQCLPMSTCSPTPDPNTGKRCQPKRCNQHGECPIPTVCDLNATRTCKTIDCFGNNALCPSGTQCVSGRCAR